MDQAQIETAASFLVGLRAADAAPAANLPEKLRPKTEAETVAIQLATMRLIGPIGGWKVGAADAKAEPVASPLPASGIRSSPASVVSRRRGIEAEIGFRFGRALPPRPEPHDAESVLGAIESCHATIETLEPRFTDQGALDALTARADLGMHGGLVVGSAIDGWTPDMFATQRVVLTADGVTICEATGSNPGGTDLVRLLVGLANSEVVRGAGGIAAGAIVTTGSWTGAIFAQPGARIVAQFVGFPAVAVAFA
jgi:2-keto-4-pentenoate hydratase